MTGTKIKNKWLGALAALLLAAIAAMALFPAVVQAGTGGTAQAALQPIDGAPQARAEENAGAAPDAPGEPAQQPRVIPGEDAPLGGYAAAGSWAVLNLVLSTGMLLGTALALACALARRAAQAGPGGAGRDRAQARARVCMRAVAGATGLFAPLMFLVLDNLRGAMVFANGNTALFVVLAWLHAAAWMMLAKRWDEKAAVEEAWL